MKNQGVAGRWGGWGSPPWATTTPTITTRSPLAEQTFVLLCACPYGDHNKPKKMGFPPRVDEKQPVQMWWPGPLLWPNPARQQYAESLVGTRQDSKPCPLS